MRLDKAVYERGLVQSRSRAEQLIKNGDVRVNGEVCVKTSINVLENDVIDVTDTVHFVGRGGLKLKKALEEFDVSCSGKTVLDIGASTGGFTQCLLENGAKKVFAIDVGTAQLAPQLKNDARVVIMEKTNARTITPDMFGKKADMAVMDVSFISQTAIFPALFSCVEQSGEIITLIKPQFELDGSKLNKNGIVKDKKLYKKVIENIDQHARLYGRKITKMCESPVLGGDGNTEFLVLLENTL